MPDIYRLKYRLWTDFVKKYGRLPPPQVWSQIRAQILTKLTSRRAGKDGREEVKQLTDKENITPVSQTETESVVFKVPAVRRQTITVPLPSENISIAENISPKENISSVGRHLPGSVTVACVTACEKSSNPRQKQKVAKYFITYNIEYITLILLDNLRRANWLLSVC